MYFPKYWAKGNHPGKDRNGREITITAYGWSSESIDDARARGDERARRVSERIFGSPKRFEYDYGNAPFREEVTDRLRVDDTDVAVLSRNRYGALVLNTSQVMFVDIDFPEERPPGIMDSLRMAFSRKRREEAETSREGSILQRIDAWSQQNPGKSFRVYRTHSGVRVLLTDGLYEPTGDEAERILSDLHADPLYRSLTARQECFRARLTPKPWRCGSAKPPVSFPWDGAEEEASYRAWEQSYQRSCKGFSTCHFLKEVGTPAGHPAIHAVVSAHDAACLNGDKPLA